MTFRTLIQETPGNEEELQESSTPPKQYTITLDDDPMIAKVIEKAIGLKSIPFFSAKELLPELFRHHPTAIFVDIHLGMDDSGLQVIPRLRAQWPFCPILVMTSDQSENAVSESLAVGADDFLQKPLKPVELLARVQIRMSELAKQQAKFVVKNGEISLDLAHRLLSGNGKQAYLSPTAAQILCCLIQAKGTLVAREVLKRKAWGKLSVTDNALDRKMVEVRKALADVAESSKIRNIYGNGFTLEKKRKGK